MEPKMDHIPQKDLFVAIEDLKGLGHGHPVHNAGGEGRLDGVGGPDEAYFVLGRQPLTRLQVAPVQIMGKIRHFEGDR